MSRIYGANPRPRALLHDIPDDLQQGYVARFPTVVAVDNLNEVDQGEFDFLVTTWNAMSAESHLRVIVFSRPSAVSNNVGMAEPTPGEAHGIRWIGTSRAREVHVPYDCPPALKSFVTNRLVPIVMAKAENPILAQKSSPHLTPFLLTARGEVLAGSFWRSPGIECWAFPGEVVQFGAECAGIAVEMWRGQDMERFPQPNQAWARQVRWRTAHEITIATALEALEQTRRHTLNELAREQERLEAQLNAAEVQADAAERRLLTAQGDELVRAVERCLTEFGLEVTYMDDRWPAGDRREDLRVRSPDGGWILVEVRGYRGGAELTDLLRLNRFRSRYVRDEGHMPAGSWYIANQFLGQDPASRPEVLSSNDAEVATFGEDEGLVISSVVLFDALMNVRSGVLSRDEVQGLLFQSRGRLGYTRRPNPSQ
jgi:hypothetical protein